MVKVKVGFGTNQFIEAEARNTHELSEIIDRYTQKFFPRTEIAETV